VSLRGGDVPGFQPYDLALYHRLCRPLIHYLWRRAAHVVANSEALRELALRSLPGLAVAVIPNGVDTELFHPPAPAGRGAAGHRLRLLFVGRLTRQKGADVLLQAMRALRGRLDVEAALAGDGDARPALERMAGDLGLRDAVRFLGWCDRARIAAESRAADVFVLPSRDEGMSNAILEAMAAGLPVVATGLAANRQLVAEGSSGLLTPPDQPEALAEAILRLGADAALRQRLGAAGRARVERDFSWRETARAYLHLAGLAMDA
jgi:glycosyltransferase involved in cell wall biosynthesis